MKMKKIVITCLIMLPLLMNAQLHVSQADSKVLIKGTSTIHDWRCQVEKIDGLANVEKDGTTITGISSMNVTLDVMSIRSIETDGSYYETGMDKKVYEALLSKTNPQITATLLKVDSVDGNKYTATVNLTIAGLTKPVSMEAQVTSEANGSIRVQGVLPMNMTDFKVTPPTALFGAIKSGDAITVEYNILFK